MEKEQIGLLHAKKRDLEPLVKTLREESRLKNQEYARALNDLEALSKEISNIRHLTITMSDHAVLRYLERSMPLDISRIRNEILTEEFCFVVKKMGDGKYPVGKGLKAVVVNSVIVTITS